jgi:hypothetical protein
VNDDLQPKIVARLFVSQRTVEWHPRKIFDESLGSGRVGVRVLSLHPMRLERADGGVSRDVVTGEVVVDHVPANRKSSTACSCNAMDSPCVIAPISRERAGFGLMFGRSSYPSLGLVAAARADPGLSRRSRAAEARDFSHYPQLLNGVTLQMRCH